jgi:hypothetical protein
MGGTGRQNTWKRVTVWVHRQSSGAPGGTSTTDQVQRQPAEEFPLERVSLFVSGLCLIGKDPPTLLYIARGKRKSGFNSKISCHSLNISYAPCIITYIFCKLFDLIYLSTLQGIENFHSLIW